MLALLFTCTLLIKFGCAQIDGEFWWLNDKFAKYIGSRPPLPKFEDLSEFDTDESAKIIFRDDNLITNGLEATESSLTKGRISDEERRNIIKWPDEENVLNSKEVINSIPEQHLSKLNDDDIGDRLIFKFPDKDNIFNWKDPFNMTIEKEIVTKIERRPDNTSISTSRPILYDNEVSFNMHFEDKLSENICTYMKKTDCHRGKGVLNNNLKDQKKENINQQLICCILPLQHKNEDISPMIYFPDTSKAKRLKRSENVGQKQRNILLQRKYANSNQKTRPSTQIKIATPDYEYDDPYWNIKTPKKSNKQMQESNTRYDYNSDDYIEDYAVELPRPGLTGLYSDNGRRPTGWTFINQNKGSGYGGADDYDDDDVGSFGYSTINPRIGSGTTRKSRPRGKPLKLTTTSDETGYDAESQTISYQSNPDFNVLQNFKLLNLMRNKNKAPKIPRSTTTESFSDNVSKESLLSGPFDTSSDINSDDFEDRQVFKDCGRTAKPMMLQNKGKQIGDTENGSHPWLALLVPTRKLNNVLCYASLVHPRAAISAADCVHRRSPGEITLIAGLWNLNERSRSRSRIISTLLHSKYKNGGLNNNLAMLHWKLPLKLGLNVQPVCLANPYLGNECMFVGWGGFDQAIRPRSRWQRASVHTCSDRLSLSGVDVPSEAFCASVQARGTVTGIGGSLVCNMNGHPAAVGVAVSRDSTLVLLPIHEWVTEAIGVLQE